MTPARRSAAASAASYAVALALAVGSLAGLQVMRPEAAAAAGPTPAPASPTPTTSTSPTSAATPTPAAGTPASPKPTPSPSASSAPPTATPSPTPSATPSPTPSVQPAVLAAAAAPPVLSVTVTPAPSAIAKAGQAVTYTVAVVNGGGQAVRDLVVTAVSANVHALTCAPVAQGGTLAAGGRTTCTGSATSTQEDLRNRGGTVSATAVGFAPDGSAVGGSATGTVTLATAPPTATPDSAVTTSGTPVVLEASRNDGPSVPGGPAIDPSRTLFKQRYHPEVNPDENFTESSHGQWFVRQDGSVEFVPNPTNVSGGTDTVPYRVFDTAGQSAVADLTVTVRAGARAVADPVTTSQGLQAVVHPLANDRPGQKLDGGAASLITGSLRFADTQPIGNATVSSNGSVLDLPFTGHLEVSSGDVVFQPDRTFQGTVPVAYTVEDTVGNVASATVTFTVTPQVPTARNLSAVVGGQDEPGYAIFHWSAIDTAAQSGVRVEFAGFTGPDGNPAGSPIGTAFTTPQGTWVFRSQEDIPELVLFDAAPGFSGTTSVGYALADNNGTRATATLTVTTRPGATTRADVVVSRRGADATVDPAANDTPGQHADGSPGSFNPRYATFPPYGQPSGSVVSDGGKTLTVPNRGRLWFSAGRITFRPQAGFTGDGGDVLYSVEQTGASVFERGYDFTGSVRLVVTSDRPVATNDSAVTTYERAVTLPGATNDDLGSAPGPLTTTFPTPGQPPGAVVAPDRRSVSVPDEGVWTLTTSGAATFAPTSGFVGSASDVSYRITRPDGASATATLHVSVAQGITAGPVAVVRAQDRDAVLDPLASTRPGYSADRTIGTLDRASVRFPTSGQPVGAQVSEDRLLLRFDRGSASAGFTYRIDAGTGLVHASVPSGHRGPAPQVRVAVQGTVVDARGVVVRQQAVATVMVTVEGRDPVAVDDHVVVPASRPYAQLPGPRNDIPASALLPLDLEDTSFPFDQLPGLPKGSVIRFLPEQNSSSWYASVPGEGTWTVSWYSSGQVSFQAAPGFTGTTSPFRYRTEDSAGNADEGVMTVTVLEGAVLRPDTGTTRQGVPVTVDVAANDTPAPTIDGAQEPGPPGATIVVKGEGTYRIGYGSTRVTFVPLKGFRGTTTPVPVHAGSGTAPLRIRVDPVDPVARDDAATTPAGTPVQIRVLDDDDPGTTARPLVSASVRFAAAPLPAGATVSTDRQVLAVRGRGVFAAAGDGTVTFYPLAGSTGAVPDVDYQVADVNGTRATATVSVRVA